MSTMKKGRMLSGSQQYAAADSCGILLLRGLLKDKMFGSLVNKLKQKFSRKTKLQTDYYSLTVDKPLILVIAAVCMLVLITVPLLKTYVLTSRKEDEKFLLESAQAAADQMMETLSPYSLEEICFRLTSEGREVILPGHNGPSWKDGQFIPQSGETEGMEDGPGADRYMFVLNNVSGEGRQYDALIELDAHNYRKDMKQEGTAYNVADYSAVASYDSERDYMFLQNPEDDLQKYREIGLALGDKSAADDEIGAHTVRTIKVDINGSVIEAKVTASVSYDYTGDRPSDFEAPGELQYSSQTFSSSDGRAVPENVFICYYPDYYSNMANNAGSGGTLDNIVINNTAGIPVRVIIVKQTGGEASAVMSLENSYRVKVSVNEPYNDSDSVTDIVTNLGVNTGVTGMKQTVKGQAAYSYKSRMQQMQGDADLIRDIMDISGLDNPYTMNRMYDTTVRIYKEGSSDKILKSLESGLSVDDMDERPVVTVSSDDNTYNFGN
jgi:hypothetical protein